MKNQNGFTLTETMMSVTILSIIVIGAITLFRMQKQTFPHIEAKTTLKNMSEKSFAQIATDLTECKRIFHRTVSDVAFQSRIQLSTGVTVLADSQLPIIETNKTLTPGTTTFATLSVGNVLFFASIEPPRDFTVLNASSSSTTVRVDIYRFNYYFLSPQSTQTIWTLPKRVLKRGTSGRYVDYVQLLSLSDLTTRSRTVQALYAAGIRSAWNPAQTDVTNAFFTLTAAGAITLDTTHTISITTEDLMSAVTGISGGGYRYGIAPNSSSGIPISQTIPALGTASGQFPSGFEIAIVGPSGSRKVLIRMVITAQGSFKGLLSNESTAVTSVRDLW